MAVPAGGDDLVLSDDPTQPIGLVRLLIADTSPTNQLLTDEQLEGLLIAEGQVVKLAAASALEVIARSELLIAKKISTQDLSTDGPAVAAELRAQAKALREQAAKDRSDGGLDPTQALLPLYSFPSPVAHGDSYL